MIQENFHLHTAIQNYLKCRNLWIETVWTDYICWAELICVNATWFGKGFKLEIWHKASTYQVTMKSKGRSSTTEIEMYRYNLELTPEGCIPDPRLRRLEKYPIL